MQLILQVEALNDFIEMLNIDRENFDEEALICQNFPPSNICAVRYLQSEH